MTTFLEHARLATLAIGLPRTIAPGSDVRFASSVARNELSATVVRHIILDDDTTVSVLAFDACVDLRDQLAYLSTAHAVLDIDGEAHYFGVRLVANSELADRCRVSHVELVFELHPVVDGDSLDERATDLGPPAAGLRPDKARLLTRAIYEISERFAEAPSVETMVEAVSEHLTGDADIDGRICEFSDYTLMFYLRKEDRWLPARGGARNK